jgi:type IV pilus assembly protein PilY1
MQDASNASSTLADVAMYYYETDLRDTSLGNCTGASSPDFPAPQTNPDVCTNNVFTSNTDNKEKQHMTTFTMGLGAEGTLNFAVGYDTATTGDFYNLKHGLGSPTANWPNPITNTKSERIDDLWHAAVNGRGLYFSAKDPDQIVAGFSAALESISAKLGAGAAAASSTLNPVSGNDYAYVASYTSSKWTGNLEARWINPSTGAISTTPTWCVESIHPGSCAGVTVPPVSPSTISTCVETNSTAADCSGNFDPITSICRTDMTPTCPGKMPPQVAPGSLTPRTIWTANDAGTALTLFNAAYATAHSTNFDAAHVSGLNQWASISTQHTVAKLFNYLIGSAANDGNASLPVDRWYRAREATMGDAIDSQPAFIAAPTFDYSYPGYQAFKSANAARAGTVYVGTNDGMLHAFDGAASETDPSIGGTERWAYVPTPVIPNMWKLASTNYATNHANFVNASPIISDIYYCTTTPCVGGSWRTILVGGLAGGGRGYYALDITNPAAPALLWEFTASKAAPDGDRNLGYSYGRPVIARRAMDDTWVVVFTSGYDNGTLSSNLTVNNNPTGDGLGHLYVVNASTGKMMTTAGKIDTTAGTASDPSGLGQIAIWNNTPNTGNDAGYVYGGDLKGNVWRFDINTGATLLFATLSDGTSPQPVTTTPVLGSINNSTVVFIGTGKYLEQSDLSNTQVQTQYALKDDGTSVGSPRSHTSGAGKMVQHTIITSNSGTTRSIESPPNAVDWNTDRGWYADFPDHSSGSERQNVDGQLVQGILIVPTIVPSSSACSTGGWGWLNYFSFDTGELQSIKYDSPIVGVNVLYLGGNGGTPKVEVVSVDNPTPHIATDPGFGRGGNGSDSFKGTRSVWRELLLGQ